MLRLGGLAASVEQGEERAARALADGSAREAFERNVRLQGGDLAAALAPGREAAVVRPLAAPRDGVVARLDAFAVGMAAVRLGAGRAKQGDPVFPEVGVVLHRKVGERARRGEPLAEAHGRDEASVEEALADLRQAYEVADPARKPAPAVGPLIVKEIGD